MKKLIVVMCILMLSMSFSGVVFAKHHHNHHNHNNCNNYYYDHCGNRHYYDHCDDHSLSPYELGMLTAVAMQAGTMINNMINPPSNSRTEYRTERINRYENGQRVGSETVEHIDSYHINDQYLLHNAR